MKSNTPLDIPFFTGRTQEVREIERALTSLDSNTNIVSITGLGGIGKTSLALFAARRLEKKGGFPGGTVWIDCQANNTLPKILTTIAQSTKIASGLRGISFLRDAVHSYLRTSATLLIFDSFEATAQDDEVLSFVGRLPQRSKAIIVSRQRIATHEVREYSIRLGAFSKSEARKFLYNRIGPRNAKDLKDDVFEKLYNWSGGIPLALALVSDILEQGGTEKDFEKQIQELITSSESLLSKDYSPINIILSRISAGLTTDEIELLEILSVFEHPVSIEVIFSVSQTSNLRVSARRISRELSRRSFIEITDNRYAFHPAIRNFFRDRIPKEHYQLLQRRMVEYYEEFVQNFDRDLNMIDKEWLNIDHSIETAYQLQVWREFIVLVLHVSPYLSSRGRKEQIFAWLNQAIDVAKLTDDAKLQASLLRTLGLQYQEYGEIHKAIELYEKALEFSSQSRDSDGEGVSLSMLGIAYNAMRDTRKALEFNERALQITKMSGDSRTEGVVLESLGNTHYITGNYDEARKFFEEALTISRKTGNLRDESSNLVNLGNVHISLKNNLLAARYYEEALTISRKVGDRRQESEILGNLGNVYGFLGNKRESIDYYQQALLIFREIGDLRSEGATLGNIGNIYSDLGNNENAIKHYLQALALFEELADGAGVSTSLSNLGNAYSVQGDYERAFKFYEKAIDISRAIGSQNIEAGILAQIGTLYAERARKGEKDEYLSKATTFLTRALKQISLEKSPNEYAIINSILGNIYVSLSAKEDELIEKALYHYNEAQKVHSLESNPLQWAALQHNIGNVYTRRTFGGRGENQTRAIRYFHNALSIYSFEKNPAEWLLTNFNLSDTLSNINRWPEARDISTNILQTLQNTAVTTETIETVIGWYQRLGNLAQKNGDTVFATRIYTEAARRFELIAEESSDSIDNPVVGLRKQIDEKIIELREELGDEQFVIIWAESQGVLTPALAQTLQSARYLMSQEQYSDATAMFTSALDLISEMRLTSEIKRQKATIHFLKGYCLRQQGAWGDALSHQENAFHLFEEVRDFIGEAHAFLEMGNLYEIMNNYEDARLHYMDAYRLYRRGNDVKRMALALENLGKLEYRVRLFLQAAKDLEEARGLYISLGDHARAASLDSDLELAKESLVDSKEDGEASKYDYSNKYTSD